MNQILIGYLTVAKPYQVHIPTQHDVLHVHQRTSCIVSTTALLFVQYCYCSPAASAVALVLDTCMHAQVHGTEVYIPNITHTVCSLDCCVLASTVM